jgi:signal recognition particle receptor subunit beta
MWEKYYTEANAVIFVVDSSDISRLEEAKLAFGHRLLFCWELISLSASLSLCLLTSDRMFEDESLIKSETPLITFANKQDLSVSAL